MCASAGAGVCCAYVFRTICSSHVVPNRAAVWFGALGHKFTTAERKKGKRGQGEFRVRVRVVTVLQRHLVADFAIWSADR